MKKGFLNNYLSNVEKKQLFVFFFQFIVDISPKKLYDVCIVICENSKRVLEIPTIKYSKWRIK